MLQGIIEKSPTASPNNIAERARTCLNFRPSPQPTSGHTPYPPSNPAGGGTSSPHKPRTNFLRFELKRRGLECVGQMQRRAIVAERLSAAPDSSEPLGRSGFGYPVRCPLSLAPAPLRVRPCPPPSDPSPPPTVPSPATPIFQTLLMATAGSIPERGLHLGVYGKSSRRSP